ncbi:peptide/nickel transport system ATP-binding protein [Friedmanniella luteola]|uniref:Peptide/nickel transport system ATP-binding protein n=1 Tax=Friedmanniella luteola TaxID=546871 RepID=A0A1H1XRH0_9ACTN|nr:ABC transporter ATP-binding protein [Friedmanniella luteola]SDT11763.1 peptide/nickel transport system ATP-binding protein [Friedmanniella luteola]
MSTSTTGVQDRTLVRRSARGPVNRNEVLLEVKDLRVTFQRRGGHPTRAVDGVSFAVKPGEVVGIVGESGSGKSVTSMAVMGLLPSRGVQVSGQALYRGQDLLTLPAGQLSDLRGRELAMVFQDPMSSLNPVVPVGTQVTEVLLRHQDISRSAARDEAEDLLRRCGIPDPGRRLKEYPHQLSGGMRQRALIAIALACKPALLICDEPTTALDVTIQAQVLELLKELVNDLGTAMVMITHDLGVVAGLCDFVNVMYAGRVVEAAPRRELFGHPRHRYTEGLLASIPRLDAPRGEPLRPIPGTPRDVLGWSQGCAFAPRCRHAADDCIVADLPLEPLGRLAHEVRCVHPAAEAAGPAHTSSDLSAAVVAGTTTNADKSGLDEGERR